MLIPGGGIVKPDPGACRRRFSPEKTPFPPAGAFTEAGNLWYDCSWNNKKGNKSMEKDHSVRHRRIWRLLYWLLHGWICRKFALSHEDLHLDGPCLLISNHVTTWDPLLVAMSLRDKQTYFVASEHLFRLGLVTRLLNDLVAPIPRRKAAAGSDTARACLRHLRAGRSVCIFAEGEQCWDGHTGPIFPATGKLAKVSGASLVTFRLEGGYLSLPRWGRGVRRGRMHGAPVRIYSPAELKTMTPGEIDAAIQADIREDAWARQEETPAAYRGKRRAEGLERALFLCPVCGQIGTLRTEGDRLFCSCGLNLCYTETGTFDPPAPFDRIDCWDAWQHEALRRRTFVRKEGAPLFSDGDMTLTAIGPDHRETALGAGTLEQYEDRLVCAGQTYPLSEIRHMAMVKTDLLLLSVGGQYVQIQSQNGANLRKYLAVWKEQ